MSKVTWTSLLGACTVLAGAAAEPPASNVESIAPRVWEVSYHSAVLNRAMALCVVVPEGYREDGPAWPEVVFLHGAGRGHRTLVDRPATLQVLLAQPFVTILPGGLLGWYVDSPLPDGPQYQQALTEALAVAEARLNVRHNAAGRAIGGWSMGGYGAAWYAVCHSSEFGALGTVIGCLDFPNADLPKSQNHAVPAHFGSVEGWPALNPINGLARLRGWRIYHNTATRAFDRRMNEQFDARLTELVLEHQFEVLEGAHTFDVVERSLPLVCHFFAAGWTEEAAGDG